MKKNTIQMSASMGISEFAFRDNGFQHFDRILQFLMQNIDFLIFDYSFFLMEIMSGHSHFDIIALILLFN